MIQDGRAVNHHELTMGLTGGPAISLPQYEGPLDLLLDLVRKHQLNILDLPVAEVTRQYLDYLHQARELNVDLGADFVLMAATLIHIKSRSLLRSDEPKEEPDPRQELVEQLLTREQAQRAAALLAERLRTASNTWSAAVPVAELEQFGENELRPEPPLPTPERPRGTMNLLEVLRVTKQALATAKAHRLLSRNNDAVTVEEMIRWLARRMNQLRGRESLTFTDLFADHSTAERRATLFLALLEMARRQDIRLLQEEEFWAPIYISLRNSTA
jgi:segregation and condensation protein A